MFASIFPPIKGFATILALLGIGPLPVGRKHPMVLVTMRAAKAALTVRTDDLRRLGGMLSPGRIAR